MVLERSGEHRDGIRGAPGTSDTGSYRGAGIWRISQAAHVGSFHAWNKTRATKPERCHLQLGRRPQSRVPRLCAWHAGSVGRFMKPNRITTRYGASRPPRREAQGLDRAGLGSGGAPDRCSCNGPPGEWAELGLCRRWSTAQRQEVSLLPAGLRLLVAGSASSPDAKASQESRCLISWKTLPGLCSSIPLLRPPASTAAAVQALRSLRISHAPPARSTVPSLDLGHAEDEHQRPRHGPMHSRREETSR